MTNNTQGYPVRFVVGSILEASQVFTRPANATAYTNGDIVSNDATTTTMMTFKLGRVASGTGNIVKAVVWTDQKACVGVLRLRLFNASDASVPADNAANTTIYANATKYIDSIDFPALAEGVDTSGSTGAKAVNDTCRVPYVSDASGDVYGALEVVSAAFTPASAQGFTVLLTAETN